MDAVITHRTERGEVQAIYTNQARAAIFNRVFDIMGLEGFETVTVTLLEVHERERHGADEGSSERKE